MGCVDPTNTCIEIRGLQKNRGEREILRGIGSWHDPWTGGLDATSHE